LEVIQHAELDKLEEKLQNDVNFVKIKPKANMRFLQTEEKLFAVNERYGEAQKIHKELKQLEASEHTRVVNKILND
jgi:hypothetical protein